MGLNPPDVIAAAREASKDEPMLYLELLFHRVAQSYSALSLVNEINADFAKVLKARIAQAETDTVSHEANAALWRIVAKARNKGDRHE